MADEAILRVILEGEHATVSAAPTQMTPSEPPVYTPPTPATQLHPPPPQTQLQAPARITQLATEGTGQPGSAQRTWYQVYIVAPLPLPVTITNWVARQVRQPRPEKIPVVEPEQSGLAKYLSSFLAPFAAGAVVTKMGLMVVNASRIFVESIGKSAVAVAQFGVVLLNASANVSQFPQLIGDVVSSLAGFVAELGWTTAAIGAVTTGLGVTIALLSGLTGAGLVVGAVVLVFGALLMWTGILIGSFGTLGKYTGELVKVFASAMRSIDDMVERYAVYNPQLLQAQVLADVRQTIGDIRRAQEAGPELTRYVQARSDLQQRYEDLKVRFMNLILPVVIEGMKNMEVVVAFLNRFVEVIQQEGWAAAVASIQDIAKHAETIVAMQRRRSEATQESFPIQWLDEAINTMNQQFGNID